jgi:hypothetical protein
MKTLVTTLFLLCSGAVMAQGTSPKQPASGANRKTVLLAAPAAKPTEAAAVGPNAVPQLATPRSEYIMTDGRVTGGKTTFKSKKK